MGLLLRYSESERVIRSVGDAPNGVLGWGLDLDEGECIFGIDSHFDPLVAPKVPVVRTPKNDGTKTLVPADEIVAALEDMETAMACWTIVCNTALAIFGSLLQQGDLRRMQTVLDALAEIQQAMHARFA